MSTKKATKRALLTSILAICLCLVMLIGSTFAWFTDTASTGVNQIQSGKLDVQLLDKNDVSLEGETLTWQKPEGVTESVLWEPGCTYLTQGFRIKNAGNLALKYTVTVSGVSGNTGLLEVIKFDLVKNTDKNAPGEDLTTFKGTLEAGKVAPTEENTLYYIRGHMDENAGNKYQNMTLDGIAITVNATQAPVESDSYNNQYDANADMTPDNLNDRIVVNVTAPVVEGAENIVLTEKDKATVTVPADAVASDAKELTLSIIPKTNNESNIEITDGQTFQAYDISVSGIKSDNTEKIRVSFFVGKGLTGVKVYHDTTELIAGDDKFAYDPETGMVSFEVTSFSPFTVVYNAPVAMADGVAYNTLQEALNAGGNIVLGKDITECVTVSNTCVINLNGKTITDNSGNTITVNSGASLTINGTGTVDNVTHAKAAIVNYGTTVLNGGTYTRSLENPENNKDNSGGNSFYTILNDKGGNMTINAGVKVTNVGHFSSMIRNGGDGAATLTINGGTFTGGLNTVKNDESGTLSINGGDFSNTSQYVVMNWNKATIAGGRFAANASAEAVLFNARYNENAVGDLTITDGTFVAASSSQKLIASGGYTAGTESITGGTFNGQTLPISESTNG